MEHNYVKKRRDKADNGWFWKLFLILGLLAFVMILAIKVVSKQKKSSGQESEESVGDTTVFANNGEVYLAQEEFGENTNYEGGGNVVKDSQYMELNESACLNTLKAWNDAANQRNEAQLAELYGGVVEYYQSCLTNQQVRDSHTRFFKKYAYFYQYYDNVTFDFINGCQAQVRFDKHVQTVKSGAFTTYVSYLHMVLDGDDNVVIIGESDVTTDTNLGKRKIEMVKVDNSTSLDVIFCDANVNKRLSAFYWDLTEMGEKEEGPLATMLLTTDLARSSVNGIIGKGFKGQKDVYYCGGFASSGECGWPVIYTYNPKTKEKRCFFGD